EETLLRRSASRVCRSRSRSDVSGDGRIRKMAAIQTGARQGTGCATPEAAIIAFLSFVETAPRRRNVLELPFNKTLPVLQLIAGWGLRQVGDRSGRSTELAEQGLAALRERGPVEQCVADLFAA